MIQPMGQTLYEPDAENEFRAATQSATRQSAPLETGTPAAELLPSRPPQSASLETASGGAGQAAQPRGRTSIAVGAVAKIAGLAARETPGVHSPSGDLARMLSARRAARAGRSTVTRGVRAEADERRTAIDLEIAVEYGMSITEVAAEVRPNVVGVVEGMTALEVAEVNIAVGDVDLPDRAAPETPESRLPQPPPMP
ncbi:Asp23/Gls24 family envelope stress response protein [Streptomyces sp. NPDC059994]|uniref:Asp23/Gls24 family envelope stress response protein n=1 Tax=Streptomyces sp. NPDC059994 TaxID=3347029 RepID=UPI003687B9E9